MIETTNEIFDLIVLGVVKMQEQDEIYNEFFKLGIDRLANYYLHNDKSKYTELTNNICEFISKPLSNWNLNNIINEQFGDKCLFNVYQNGHVSSFCYEYLRNSKLPNVRELELFQKELEQRKILEFLNIKNQDTYVAVRKFIIENKYIDNTKLAQIISNIDVSKMSKFKELYYEQIPIKAINNGKIFKCPHCGWILNWKGNEPICCVPSCMDYGIDIKECIEVDIKKYRYRLTPGVMTFISKPGDCELRLYNKLKKLGLDVELWGEFDTYDLKVSFEDEEEWIIDVKDYKNIYNLVNSLKNNEFSNVVYDKAFFVIPEDRLTYKKELRNMKEVFKIKYKKKKFGTDKIEFESEQSILEMINVKIEELKNGKKINK